MWDRNEGGADVGRDVRARGGGGRHKDHNDDKDPE